jgi:hypothetical protein
MNYAARQRDFAPCFDHGIAPQRAARTRGLLRRVFAAMFNRRESSGDRELDRAFNFSGRAFSDALEREMLQPLSRPKWGFE